ncbi:MAG: endonuclease [Rhizobiaceae bacterium]
MAFVFGAAEDMEWVRDRLISCFGRPEPIHARSPIGQLVKSIISGRTRDEISLAAYRRLVGAYPEWSDLACATAADIEAVIDDVTFPDVKARHLRGALDAIAACRPDFDLTVLGGLSVAKALAWLERLPGVGRKVSASTLNFSTLRMPAFVVDMHILRILRRFGSVPSKADTETAYGLTMETLPDWSAADLAELHVLVKRLGQTICRADRADCRNCPIGRRCLVAPAVSSGERATRRQISIEASSHSAAAARAEAAAAGGARSALRHTAATRKML